MVKLDYSNRIIDMRRSGYKLKEIAETLGLSEPTVSGRIPKYLKRSGDYTKNPRVKLTAEERQIIEGEILGDGRLVPAEPESCFIHSGEANGPR